LTKPPIGPLGVLAAAGLLLGGVAVVQVQAAAPEAQAAGASETAAPEQRALLDRYCVTCHNQRLETGGLALDDKDVANLGAAPEIWEKVVKKLRSGIMPPVGRPRPDEATQDGFVAWLAAGLDNAAAARPDPGRTATFHRLNRAEYRNAIRDLLAVEINADDFLPADDSSYGFDNIGGVLRMSQALLERYLAAARTISRLAVGSPPPALISDTFRTTQDEQQHDRLERLPFGTRGGILVDYLFPLDADYDIKVELASARSLRDPQQLEITVDGEQVGLFDLAQPDSAPTQNRYTTRASELDIRVPVSAGPHEVAATFYRNPHVLLEQTREPFPNPRTSGNSGGPGGSQPFVSSVTIAGPHDARGPGNSPSGARIFTCRPSSPSDEPACARTILAGLARRAYRGPVDDEALQVLLTFYENGRASGGSFEAGIELALRRLLVSPEFLVRIEADPTTVARGAAYRIDDVALASRLSFFLWSSIPDDELLDVAEQDRLSEPAELERQVRRMLADPRAEALTENFTGQWLQLRNLEISIRPGSQFAVAFDETLRRALMRETELFFNSIVREDRSVLEILTADYTFLNERLADHYGIRGVTGSHFRRVAHPADSVRRGLLGHASILTLTSHAIRTSPVLRGKWILDNILGTPPPDPPPNIPALNDQVTQAKKPTLREQMSAHRANPVCAACHNVIDPAGFALENFDAIGRWREVDTSFNAIDASGALPDGTPFDGVVQLREALVRRPERFANTITEKLFTYSLGRGLEPSDMPAVRKIVRDASSDDFKMQSIIIGIVNSYPFLNRRTQS